METGGTGKSPLVIYLVRLLSSNGMKVATLSRGYGRSTKGFLLANEKSSSTEIGDEAKQLKMRFLSVTVAVCENRVNGVKKLLQSETPPNVIVMDDGFQHRWIEPSLSILTTSGAFPFWKNFLLPVGTLREAKDEAKRADLLVVANGNLENDHPASTPLSVRDLIFFDSQINASKPIQIHGETQDPASLKKVVLLSGIGNPQRFENTAKQLFEILDHVTFPDHHNYTAAEFKLLRKNLDRFDLAVNAVLTTEKDAMRLSGSPLLKELGKTAVFYLPIEVSIVGNEGQKFDKLILQHIGTMKLTLSQID